MKPLFEYDPGKSERNKANHGLSLVEAQQLWEGPHVIIPARTTNNEIRMAILGNINGRLFVAVFTLRQSVIRMISAHRADRRLGKVYERNLHEKKES